MEQEKLVEETLDWSEIDSDEQAYLDLLQTYGEGYVDMSRHQLIEPPEHIH